MKKIALVILVGVFASTAFAASSMTPTTSNFENGMVLVRIVCVAHTDGTFTDYSINLPQLQGKRIINAWAVNAASPAPASGAVTITDATGQQLIGSTVGDTLTLSTSAAGVAHLTIDRGSGQRTIASRPIVSVSTVTTNGGTFTLYLLCQ